MKLLHKYDFYERYIQRFVMPFSHARANIYLWDIIRIVSLISYPYYLVKAIFGVYNTAKINVGVGASRLRNWFHVDGNPLRRPDLWHDVRNRWPFRSNSIAGIAAAHLLEHLFEQELRFVLKEMFRVLRPGGFVRISVPSLEKALTEYLNSPKDVSRSKRFNKLSHWYGAHHHFFDFCLLNHFLLVSGFISVQRLEFPYSNFLSEEEVRDLERRPEESLMVECVKPSVWQREQ